MGKFSGILLASDYDETLYGADVGVSAENRKAIQYFISEGGYHNTIISLRLLA